MLVINIYISAYSGITLHIYCNELNTQCHVVCGPRLPEDGLRWDTRSTAQSRHVVSCHAMSCAAVGCQAMACKRCKRAMGPITPMICYVLFCFKLFCKGFSMVFSMFFCVLSATAPRAYGVPGAWP